MGGPVERVTANSVVPYLSIASDRTKGFVTGVHDGGYEVNNMVVAKSGTIYGDIVDGERYNDATSLFPDFARRYGTSARGTHAAREHAPEPRCVLLRPHVVPGANPCRGYRPQVMPQPCRLGAVRYADRRHRPGERRPAQLLLVELLRRPRSSDRSWWAGLFETWSGESYDQDSQTAVPVRPAKLDTFVAAVGHACGERSVHGSLVTVVGPSPYSTQVSHLYFLDRPGNPLIYLQAT